MAKTLKQFKQGYTPRSADEKKFVDKHTVQKTPDANGNGDDVFNAKNVKMFDRELEHGYNPGSDEEVYEEASLDEMSKSQAYATGTKRAMEMTGDTPPLEKRTIKKAHKIAKAILRKEETEHVEEGLMGAIGKGVGAVAQAVKPFVKKTLQNTAQDMFPGFANPSAKKKQVNPAPPANTSPTCESKDVPFEGPYKEKSTSPSERMARVKELAQRAFDRAAKEAAKKATGNKSKKKVNETELKDHLLSLYANQLSEEENQVLQEMLQTENGTKIAFMISMMVDNDNILDEMMKKSEKYSHRGFLNKLKQNNTGA